MSAPAIRTPDQRLRVFVSSTLQELATERQVVREAIERIHLTPVMFELGARAHPPRDLYRAYLAQSDVFVGIYYGRYGWVAPGMEISGLEDEYVLSAGMPRLVYVRRADTREPRLDALLRKIEADDLSFRPFTDPAELSDLVADDLAQVLTERFAAGAVRSEPTPADSAPPPLHLPPVEHGPLFGRDALVGTVIDGLAGGSAVVTLTGPGGTGKTSVAVRVANGVADRFPDGVYYVPLAAVRDAARVMQAVATTLDLPPPQGGADATTQVTSFFRSRRALLVLDNVEQVLDAAPAVAALQGACRGLRILLTSRTALRIRGEREIPVPPLAGTTEGSTLPPAVALFEARAREVRSSFAVTPENRSAVTEICRRLDGLPLAIELAAARVRVLTPQAMLPRLGSSLALLTGGGKDLPERHQTLRGALDWSHALLTPEARVAFRRLGVFTGSFSLDAAEAVLGEVAGLDPVDGLMSLVDQNLLVRTDFFEDPRFQMLETVREFALEHLVAAGEEPDTRRRLGRWVARYLDGVLPAVSHVGNRALRERLVVEEVHICASLGWATVHDPPLAWEILAPFALTLQARMRVRDVVEWYERVVEGGACADERTRLRAVVARGGAASSSSDGPTAIRILEGVADRLRALGDARYAGWADAMLGQTYMAFGDPRGLERIEAAILDFRSVGEVNGEGYGRCLVALRTLLVGDTSRARELAHETLTFCAEHGDGEGVTSLTALLGRIALAEGDMDGARARFANAAALGRAGGATWGSLEALLLLAGVALGQRDDAAAEDLLVETVRVARAGGFSVGLELALGALAGLAVRAGAPGRAARLLQLVPEGAEAATDMWTEFADPVRSLRGAIAAARAAVGSRGRPAPDREAIYDEVIELALAGDAAG